MEVQDSKPSVLLEEQLRSRPVTVAAGASVAADTAVDHFYPVQVKQQYAEPVVRFGVEVHEAKAPSDMFEKEGNGGKDHFEAYSDTDDFARDEFVLHRVLL